MDTTAYSILDYHRETSHDRGSVTGRALNRDNVPIPFKLYRDTPIFHLPHDLSHPEVALDKALAKHPFPEKPNMAAILAGICNLTAGITQARKNGDTITIHLRAPASAGALYPAELYLAIQNADGMNDGLYHYNPLEHTLSQLRSGYVFGALSGTAPIVRFYLTAIFHRSGWKYGPRAYRYCLLDVGHMVENLRLAARIYGFPVNVDYDFNDKGATRFLDIDPEYEGCLAQVHSLGCRPETEVDETVSLCAENLLSFSRVAPVAAAPEKLLAVHQTTASFARCPIKAPGERIEDTEPLPAPVIPTSTATNILTRRSRRNFIPTSTARRDMADVLSMICHDVAPMCSNGLNVGFLASEHSGISAGYHVINKVDCSSSLVKPGDFMDMAARVCLDQGWLANAALHILFTANLEKLNAQCGPRAYRYAHLEAGRLGQRIYLAATGKQLGACGIGAFFDEEGAQLLSLPPGEVLLYLVVVGPVRR